MAADRTEYSAEVAAAGLCCLDRMKNTNCGVDAGAAVLLVDDRESEVRGMLRVCLLR